jgi:hypothetical protein
VTEKIDNISRNSDVIPIVVDPVVSKAPSEVGLQDPVLEGGLQDPLSGGTPDLEVQNMECDIDFIDVTPSSLEIPPGQIPQSPTTIDETQTLDPIPPTTSMEPTTPKLGDIENMETDKTKDTLTTPSESRNKRFKPTLTTKNSRPSTIPSVTPIPKKGHK